MGKMVIREQKNPSVCIVSLVRAPYIVLRAFIRHHQAIGVDEIILFFDDPEAEGLQDLTSISGVLIIPLTVGRCVEYGISREESMNQRQIVCAEIGLQMARKSGHDWIIHMDSDELLFPVHELKETLKKSGPEALVPVIRESVPGFPSNDNPFSAKEFRRPVGPRRTQLAKILTFGRPFFRGEFFRGHVLSKSIIRISDNLIRLKVHRAVFQNDVQHHSTEDIELLHFDAMSYESWKDKWLRKSNGSAIPGSLRNNRKSQLSKISRVLIQGDRKSRRLYRRLYGMNIYEKIILRSLGMIEHKIITIQPD